MLTLCFALLAGSQADATTASNQVNCAFAELQSEADKGGRSVAVSGDWAILGNDLEVNIYQKSATGFWTLRKTHNLAYNFGFSVAISGQLAIVGAYSEGTYGSGAAYVFERDQGGADNWGQVARLVANDGAPADYFGYSVAISGDSAIVGAYLNDEGSLTDVGAAYVFDRNMGGSDAWGQVAKLLASDGAPNHEFGYSVAISGDHAIVGAYRYDEGSRLGAGAAYVFDRSIGGSNAWGQVAKLVASDRERYDEFGISVAISGERAIVGSHNDNEDANGANTVYDAGSAYIFERNAGGADAWGQVAKLVTCDREQYDSLGLSVAISGGRAIGGAKYEDPDDGSGTNSLNIAGSAYVFSQNTGGANAWGQVNKLVASDAEARDRFGCSVAISGDDALVGAIAPNSGYFFQICNPPVFTATLTATNASPADTSAQITFSVSSTCPSLASGGPVETSVDGGSTWITGTVHSGLADGTYTLLARDSTFTNCMSQPLQLEVVDPTRLRLSCPPNLTVTYPAQVPDAFANDASANGVFNGSPNLSVTRTQQSSNACVQIWHDVFTVTDAAGNQTNCTRVVNLEFPSIPAISCPPGGAVGCGSIAPAGAASVSDPCDNGLVATLTTNINGSAGNCGVVEFVYSITNRFGNSASCTQRFDVIDSLPPTLTAPAPVTLVLGSSTAESTTGSPSGLNDNCDPSPGVTVSNTPIPSGPGSFTRTWTATDACGNTTSVSQVITLDEPSVDLQLSGTSLPAVLSAGPNLSLNVTVHNEGPDPASGVEFLHPLPPGAIVASLSPGCNLVGNNVVCNLGGLAAGRDVVISIDLMMSGHSAAPVTNVSSVTSDVVDSRPADNTLLQISTQADCEGDNIPDFTDPDDDNDLIPDAWENLHGYDACDATDAGLDDDGDGASTIQEYVADTNPRAAASVLRLTDIRNPSGGHQLGWNAKASRHYTVQSAVELAGFSVNWTDIIGMVDLPGVNGVMTMNVEPLGGVLKHYRVVVKLPVTP